jgi:2-C-methyl-D-erythritol 4-phosphate cytidylyltransferase/2-C-methyl-D-erythritol 2,4-cyclodiphosphate synthase
MINKSAAIIAAAGMGHRLGANLPKSLIKLLDKTLVEHAVANLLPVCELIIVTAPSGYEAEYTKILGDQVSVITGGVLRSDSIRIAISKIPTNFEYVLVHDAARALASTTLASSVLSQLIQGEQAVIPALDVIDTIKEVDNNGYVRNTLNRTSLKVIQTPQGFSRSVLERAHFASEDATDDAALVEALGVAVKVIAGEDRAFKITTPSDIASALKFELVLMPMHLLQIRGENYLLLD